MEKRRSKTAYFLGIVLFVGVAIGLIATALPDDDEPQVLKVNVATEPPTLDPRRAYDITSATVIRHLYDGLTRLDHEGTPRLALAEGVQISEDGRLYTFLLKKTYWETGEPVTAQDFVDSWHSVLEPLFPGEFASRLFVVKNAQLAKEGKLPLESVGVEALSDQMLRVELERPEPHFLEMVATYTFFPVHEQTRKGGEIVENGPFLLREWQHDNIIVLERNPNYWDAGSVGLDGIEFFMISDNMTELNMFEQGELHWAGSPMSALPLDALPSLQEQGLLHSRMVHSTYAYKFNIERPPFHNKKMRHALSLAIDRMAIIQHVMQGEHLPASSLVPPALGGVVRETYRPLQARKLFAEALEELGLTKEELPTPTLYYSLSDDHHKIAQVIQQQWRDTLGLKVKLENREWKVHIGHMAKNDFDIGYKSWLADYSGPSAMLDPYKYRNSDYSGANNDTRWHDPRFVEFLENHNSAAAEKVFLDALPVIPLFHVSHRYLKDPRLKDVIYAPVGQVDFKNCRFEGAM